MLPGYGSGKIPLLGSRAYDERTLKFGYTFTLYELIVPSKSEGKEEKDLNNVSISTKLFSLM